MRPHFDLLMDPSKFGPILSKKNKNSEVPQKQKVNSEVSSYVFQNLLNLGGKMLVVWKIGEKSK